MSGIKINVTVVERTSLAFLVSDGRVEAWVPLSQIEQVIEEHGVFGLDVTGIVIPDWLAADKGLQRQHDDNTPDLFGGEA